MRSLRDYQWLCLALLGNAGIIANVYAIWLIGGGA